MIGGGYFPIWEWSVHHPKFSILMNEALRNMSAFHQYSPTYDGIINNNLADSSWGGSEGATVLLTHLFITQHSIKYRCQVMVNCWKLISQSCLPVENAMPSCRFAIHQNQLHTDRSWHANGDEMAFVRQWILINNQNVTRCKGASWNVRRGEREWEH